MEKFAKVFESHGRQFLVKKSTTEDERDKLSIITQVDGSEIDVGIIFDVDDGGKAIEAAFNAYDQKDVDLIGEKIKDAESSFDVFMILAR